MRSRTLALALVLAPAAARAQGAGSLPPEWTLDPAAGDRFGSALAADGEVLAVGAAGEDERTGGLGGVFVLERVGPDWVWTGLLTAPADEGGRGLGTSLALFGDRLVCGLAPAPGEELARTSRRTPDGWRAPEAVPPFAVGRGRRAPPAPVAHTGVALVVGAPWEDARAGAALVLAPREPHELVARLASPDPTRAGRFGASVAGRGFTLVVGEPGARDAASGTPSGAVHVLELDRAGGTWSLVATLRPPDGGARGSEFGAAVALAEDAILVGAPGASAGATRAAGLVHVFERVNGAWRAVARLAADAPAADARLGARLAARGRLALAVAPGEEAVLVLERGPRAWRVAARLASPDGARDGFGSGVAVHGERAFVGAELSARFAPAGGAVFGYARDGGGAWSLAETVAPPDERLGGSRRVLGLPGGLSPAPPAGPLARHPRLHGTPAPLGTRTVR